MKLVILLSAICISISSYAQTVDSREKVTAEPGFLSFGEKIKQLPPNNPASKMKASGISFNLSSKRMEFDNDHYLEYEKIQYVWPHQAAFDINSTKDGWDGPTLFIVTRNKTAGVCLVELNVRLRASDTPQEFHISQGNKVQIIKVDASRTSFVNKKIVFSAVVSQDLNKIRIYNSTQAWIFLNCQVTYLN